MKNRMIEFERKGIVSPLTLGASSSSTPPFRNPIENNFQPKSLLPWSWCNSYTIVHLSLDIIEWFKYKLEKFFKIVLDTDSPPSQYQQLVSTQVAFRTV